MPNETGDRCGAWEEIVASRERKDGQWEATQISSEKNWDAGWEAGLRVDSSGKAYAVWDRVKVNCEPDAFLPNGKRISANRDFRFTYYAVFDGKAWSKERYVVIPYLPYTTFQDIALGRSGELFILLTGSDQRTVPYREAGVDAEPDDKDCRDRSYLEFCSSYAAEGSTPEEYEECRQQSGRCWAPTLEFSSPATSNRYPVVAYLLKIKDRKRKFYRVPDMPARPEAPDQLQMAIDREGRLHMVWREGGEGWDQPVELYYATWEEEKWSSPLRIDTGHLHPSAPRIAAGPDNTAHIDWGDALADIYYVRRPFQGEWSSVEQVTHEGGKGGVGNDYMAVDSKGNVHVVYTAGASCCPSNVYYTMKPASAEPSANGKP